MSMASFKLLARELSVLPAARRAELAAACLVRSEMVHRCGNTHGRIRVRPFPWPEYVLLCAGMKIDPVVGRSANAQTLSQFGVHNPYAFAIAIRLYRIDRKLTLRQAAERFKVAAVTLSRAENHTDDKDISVEPFLAICRGIGRHPFDFLTSASFHGKPKVEQVEKAGVSA